MHGDGQRQRQGDDGQLRQRQFPQLQQQRLAGSGASCRFPGTVRGAEAAEGNHGDWPRPVSAVWFKQGFTQSAKKVVSKQRGVFTPGQSKQQSIE